MVKKFKRGKLGRTPHSYHFPKWFKRKVHRKWNRMHRAGTLRVPSGFGDWWDDFKHGLSCIPSSVAYYHCATGGGDDGPGDQTPNPQWVKGGKIIITCGGSTIIGAIFGGVAGAGGGAPVCLWTKLNDHL